MKTNNAFGNRFTRIEYGQLSEQTAKKRENFSMLTERQMRHLAVFIHLKWIQPFVEPDEPNKFAWKKAENAMKKPETLFQNWCREDIDVTQIITEKMGKTRLLLSPTST